MEKITFNTKEIAKTINGLRINDKKVILASTTLQHWSNEKCQFVNDFDSLSIDEFSRKVTDVISKGVDVYHSLTRKMTQVKTFEQVQNILFNREDTIAKIVSEAEKRYKKEYYRNNFIANEIKNHDISSLNFISTKGISPLKKFYFDSHFGGFNGCNMFNLINEKCDINTAQEIYNSIKNNDIMKHAKEIRLVYHYDDKYFTLFSQPTLEFEMDEEGERIIQEKKESIERAINNFYANSSYFGD